MRSSTRSSFNAHARSLFRSCSRSLLRSFTRSFVGSFVRYQSSIVHSSLGFKPISDRLFVDIFAHSPKFVGSC